jgi:alcohol dehydrogenase class IV
VGDFAGSGQRVVFGPGSVKFLPEVLGSLGVTRPLVVAGPTVAGSAVFAAVTAQLSRGEFEVFSDSRPHAPQSSVLAGLELLDSSGADGLISLGGSSPVEVARGIAYFKALGPPFGGGGRPAHVPHTAMLPIVSITTTLSQAEFSNVLGLTNDETGVKTLYFDHGFTPACVILDAELALHTPERLWLGTGVKAMDTAIDCFLQFLGAQRFWDSLLLSSISDLFDGLTDSPRGTANSHNRGALQVAAWEAIYPRFHLPLDESVPRATQWLGAALRHQLGGMYRCAHGELAGVLLAPCLRFHRQETGHRQELLAKAMGAGTLKEMDASIQSLVLSLGLPSSLSELGIGAEHLDRIVKATVNEAPSLSGRESDIQRLLESLL